MGRDQPDVFVMWKALPAWLSPAPDSLVGIALQRCRSPWLHAVHLLWSVWVFLTPLFGGGFSWQWAALTLVSYPLFLLLFAMTLLMSQRTAYRPALGMVALSMVLLPVYPSGISYFIFGCVMLHGSTRTMTGYLGQLLLLNTAFWALAWWIGYPLRVMVWIPVLTFIIGVIVHVDQISQDKDAALKLSHDEVRRLAATAERERIGRDLHDLLGHTLSLITLKLELSRKLADRDSAASRREVDEAERIARHALAEVRSAVTGIRATDLAAELASARLLLESSAVHLDYDAPPGLPSGIERALALVLREAVTNIARHARASQAQVTFGLIGGNVQLDIVDNGRGGIAQEGSRREGNGLGGMRERVAALGGTLGIESPKGHGTRLRVCVPMPPGKSLGISPELPLRAAVAEPHDIDSSDMPSAVVGT
jgi:two-component system sensor histidine kinase DesK